MRLASKNYKPFKKARRSYETTGCPTKTDRALKSRAQATINNKQDQPSLKTKQDQQILEALKAVQEIIQKDVACLIELNMQKLLRKSKTKENSWKQQERMLRVKLH